MFEPGLKEDRRIRNLRLGLSMAAYSVVLAITCPVMAQIDKSTPCITDGESIFAPGEDHVKPPKLQIEHPPLDKPVKLNSQVVLEVLINSAGTICEVRALKALTKNQQRNLQNKWRTIFAFVPQLARANLSQYVSKLYLMCREESGQNRIVICLVS